MQLLGGCPNCCFLICNHANLCPKPVLSEHCADPKSIDIPLINHAIILSILIIDTCFRHPMVIPNAYSPSWKQLKHRSLVNFSHQSSLKYNVGTTVISHPWLGMVYLYQLLSLWFSDCFGMVYGIVIATWTTDFTYISHFTNFGWVFRCFFGWLV